MQGMSPEDAKRAKLGLLKQQVRHLSTIDQMKALHGNDRRQARIRDFFTKAGDPHQWTEKEYGTRQNKKKIKKEKNKK